MIHFPTEQYLAQFYQEDFGSHQVVHPLFSTKSRENQNSNISDRISELQQQKAYV